MDKVIAGIAKVLRDSEQSLARCLREICDVLQDHEKRLQKLEGLDVDAPKREDAHKPDEESEDLIIGKDDECEPDEEGESRITERKAREE